MTYGTSAQKIHRNNGSVKFGQVMEEDITDSHIKITSTNMQNLNTNTARPSPPRVKCSCSTLRFKTEGMSHCQESSQHRYKEMTAIKK